MSDNPAARAGDFRPDGAYFGAVAACSVGRDRVNRPAILHPGHGKDRFHVGAERVFQRLGRHQRVIVLLEPVQRRAINQQRLRIGAADFIGASASGFQSGQ